MVVGITISQKLQKKKKREKWDKVESSSLNLVVYTWKYCSLAQKWEGSGREKSTEAGKRELKGKSSPTPLLFSLLPYPLPLSTPATQAGSTAQEWSTIWVGSNISVSSTLNVVCKLFLLFLLLITLLTILQVDFILIYVLLISSHNDLRLAARKEQANFNYFYIFCIDFRGQKRDYRDSACIKHFSFLWMWEDPWATKACSIKHFLPLTFSELGSTYYKKQYICSKKFHKRNLGHCVQSRRLKLGFECSHIICIFVTEGDINIFTCILTMIR